MLARSLDHIIILVQFRSKLNFIQHCFCDLGSHFEALESVLLIFCVGFTSKKYDQTDSRAPKCLPRVTKTVMYILSKKKPSKCKSGKRVTVSNIGFFLWPCNFLSTLHTGPWQCVLFLIPRSFHDGGALNYSTAPHRSKTTLISNGVFCLLESKILSIGQTLLLSCSSVCHQLDSWSVFAYPKQRATVLVRSVLK
jgi:hypothetical protein